MKAPLLSLSPIAIAMLGLMACSPASETSQTTQQPPPVVETESQTDSARVNAFLNALSKKILKARLCFKAT